MSEATTSLLITMQRANSADTGDSFLHMLDMLLSDDDQTLTSTPAEVPGLRFPALTQSIQPNPLAASLENFEQTLTNHIQFMAKPMMLPTSVTPCPEPSTQPAPKRRLATSLAQRQSHQRTRIKKKNEVSGDAHTRSDICQLCIAHATCSRTSARVVCIAW